MVCDGKAECIETGALVAPLAGALTACFRASEVSTIVANMIANTRILMILKISCFNPSEAVRRKAWTILCYCSTHDKNGRLGFAGKILHRCRGSLSNFSREIGPGKC